MQSLQFIIYLETFPCISHKRTHAAFSGKLESLLRLGILGGSFTEYHIKPERRQHVHVLCA